MSNPDAEDDKSEDIDMQQSQTFDSDLDAKTDLFKAGIPFLPEQDEEKGNRDAFESQIQYIFAVIGMAVGLGNIWRFPAVAYENGGAAFLIAYFCMGALFGLPMIYIDSCIGQFMQNSPSIVFKQFAPAAQGLGWTMAFISISIGFIYNVPCCWAFMYITQLIIGNMKEMSSCQNEWNTINCHSSLFCADNIEEPVYFNGTCMTNETYTNITHNQNLNISLHSAQEEYFYYFITNKHASFAFGHFNWMFAGCLLVCWTVTALGLIKGVQSLGKVALVTTMLPYIIITILFIRGITLEGANIGIEYFLTKPDWSKLLKYETWVAALSQSAFSLSIGVGQIIMMSSYNKRTHANYRDCVIILCADTFMSVMGGTAVFAIMGSMAQRMGVNISDVISSPLTLAFIAYPEATSHMPASTLWALLFFIMIFVIGISSMFGLVEGFASCIIDQFPKLIKWHWLIVTIICVNGYHIFAILNAYLGGVSLPGSLIIETIIIMLYYGAPRLFRDIQCMHGLPTSVASQIFGNLGVYVKIGVTFTAPLLALAMGVLTISKFVTDGLKMGEDNDGKYFAYPITAVAIGLAIGVLPLFLVPIGTFVNVYLFNRRGEPLMKLLQLTDDHPTVRYNLPEPVSWREYFFPPLRSQSNNPQSGNEAEPDSGVIRL